MKSPFKLRPLSNRGLRSRHPSGMALILVLTTLGLFAGLVLAIFFTSQVERQSSSLFSSSVEVKSLADTSVNLCIAQITDATTQSGRAWASQPGLIRTFTGNRQPDTSYRLYSWADMRPSSGFDPFSTANAVPSDWNERTALYVDLNEPVPSPSAPNDPAHDRYPILYPPSLTASGSTTKVAGYSVNSAPVSAGNEVPMPVQWLYVLSDGSLKSGVSVSGTKTLVEVPDASESNPIVGRIAFWADDESTKVNINTAAGGEFWTPPWYQTNEELTPVGPVYGFGFSQPVKNEFQRYPGHPARTDMRAVFPELTWNEIYKLTPRVAQGGSENGTAPLTQNSILPNQDTDRLYASLGELRFAAAKNPSASRNQQGAALPSLSANAATADSVWTNLVEKRKAFLTTSSRAPELTLFGTPRVACWPIHELNTAPSNSPYRSGLDNLISFCSTVTSGTSSYPFYFTRQFPFSESADISLPRNTQIYRYLQRLTGLPFPGLSETTVADKYGAQGRDQILTEIFDYIRIINMQDMQLAENRQYSNSAAVVPTRWDPGSGETRGFGRTYTIRQAGLMFICTADAANATSNVAPGESPSGAPPENKSLDSFSAGGKLSHNQRRIQALLVLELFCPSAGYKQFNHSPALRVRGLESLTVETSLTPAQNVGFPDGTTGTPKLAAQLGSYNGGTGGAGGAINYRWIYLKTTSASQDVRTTKGLAGDNGGFPYIGEPLTVTFDPAQPQMTVHGGPITVEFYTDDSLTTPLNSVQINLDTVTLPLPTLHSKPEFWAFHKSGIFGDFTENLESDTRTGTPGRLRDRTLQRTNTSTNDLNALGIITKYDTVQTYILPHGDYRMLYGPASTGKSYIPVPAATHAGAFSNLRHFLSDSGSGIVGFYRGTTLTPDVPVLWTSNVNGYAAPPMRLKADYPANLNAPWTFGDWDVGSPWSVTDGPLINKVDEGNLFQLHNSLNPFTYFYSLPGANPLGIHYHSANRQMPSPVMFGSLPTGLISGQPWQTLLFRPSPGHPGEAAPHDNLLLDLFWMPIVEPYAISEPFSTAGKINMNWQMIPFTYIERSTGIHALLRNEQIASTPEDAWSSTNLYGKISPTLKNHPSPFYWPVNVEQTLTPFRTRFQNGEVFLSPSEITQLYLVPDKSGTTYQNTPAFWAQHRMTGENAKERPYAYLYPRLTTKSNVFNVHYRVQRLKKRKGGDPNIWDEKIDHAVAELRGNTVIERFIDMNRSGGIPDYATDSTANAESLYRFRILSNKEFTP